MPLEMHLCRHRCIVSHHLSHLSSSFLMYLSISHIPKVDWLSWWVRTHLLFPWVTVQVLFLEGHLPVRVPHFRPACPPRVSSFCWPGPRKDRDCPHPVTWPFQTCNRNTFVPRNWNLVMLLLGLVGGDSALGLHWAESIYTPFPLPQSGIFSDEQWLSSLEFFKSHRGWAWWKEKEGDMKNARNSWGEKSSLNRDNSESWNIRNNKQLKYLIIFVNKLNNLWLLVN